MLVRIRPREILIMLVSPPRIINREYTCYLEKRTVQPFLLTHFLLLSVCLLYAGGERLLQIIYQVIHPGLEECFGSLIPLSSVGCKLGVLLSGKLESMTHLSTSSITGQRAVLR